MKKQHWVNPFLHPDFQSFRMLVIPIHFELNGCQYASQSYLCRPHSKICKNEFEELFGFRHHCSDFDPTKQIYIFPKKPTKSISDIIQLLPTFNKPSLTPQNSSKPMSTNDSMYCGICLETSPSHSSIQFPSCTHSICKSCFHQLKTHQHKICPFCRTQQHTLVQTTHSPSVHLVKSNNFVHLIIWLLLVHGHINSISHIKPLQQLLDAHFDMTTEIQHILPFFHIQ